MNRTTQILLNLAHALDHFFLLIFAAAVGAIAQDFGLARWEDMMPYTTGAFVLFGLGSVPAGRLGDLWGRRRMMLVFFFGMGLSALAVACTQSPREMALALVVRLGAKKLEKESVVCLRTALFLGNLDGRHRSKITQDTDSKTR